MEKKLNLFNFLPKDEEEAFKAQEYIMHFCQRAVALGGTVSAEHGIGKLKKDYLRILYPPDVLEEMKTIKGSLDPDHVLNPGNVI